MTTRAPVPFEPFNPIPLLAPTEWRIVEPETSGTKFWYIAECVAVSYDPDKKRRVAYKHYPASARCLTREAADAALRLLSLK